MMGNAKVSPKTRDRTQSSLQKEWMSRPNHFAIACHEVRGIYHQDLRYAKAGVILLDISQASERQFSLFSGQEDTRWSPTGLRPSPQLMETMDMLNRIYGRNAVFFGSSGIGGAWKMKRDRCTPCYTTRWKEIPMVR